MRLASLLFGGLAFAFCGSIPPARAHADLLRATPQAGSVVAKSPLEVRLQFSEGIEARFSRVEIIGAEGKRVTLGRSQVQGTAMVVPITEPLFPGRYQVNWRVLSADGHKTNGSFTFEVGP